MIGAVPKIERDVVFTFEELDVWKKAFAISMEVHRASLEFPKIEQYALADQIRRASKSICANIAEGFAKQKSSKSEFKRFLMMALGSANEMLVWIRYCKELGYISPELYQAWYAEYSSVCKMINSFHERVA